MPGLPPPTSPSALATVAPLRRKGSFFHRTYMREGRPDPPSSLSQSTEIVRLVTRQSFSASARHRLSGDGVFPVYWSDPCEMIVCSPSGVVERLVLGSDLLTGHCVHHVIAGGRCQGIRWLDDGSYALLGTTMAPGSTIDGLDFAGIGHLATTRDSTAALLRPVLAKDSGATAANEQAQASPANAARRDGES